VRGDLGEEVDDGSLAAGVMIVGEDGEGVLFSRATIEVAGVATDAGEVAGFSDDSAFGSGAFPEGTEGAAASGSGE